MKLFKKLHLQSACCLMASMALLTIFSGCKKENHPLTLSVTTIASGLAGPMGIETDNHGNIWVTESGTDIADQNGNTHNDNGKVVMITRNGKKYDAIIHLSSYANVHSNELQGTVHILRQGKVLYILSGDYLYKADVSGFKPGDKPMDAKVLAKEDIGAIVSKIPSPNNPDKDSHPYNLTVGPDGDLYIADAGANAILHRSGENQYSILAEIPALPNPLFPGVGGPVVQAVPTSVWYDGHDFLVTTLTGFPFVQGKAAIYKVSKSGKVSVYQDNYTMLVDQARGFGANIVLQYANSFGLGTNFEPNSGSLIWTDGKNRKTIADGLNQPVGIKQVDNSTWYVTSMADGSVLKVSYY